MSMLHTRQQIYKLCGDKHDIQYTYGIN